MSSSATSVSTTRAAARSGAWSSAAGPTATSTAGRTATPTGGPTQAGAERAVDDHTDLAESPRRTLSARQSATVQRLVDAALGEIRAVGFEQLTIRNVAQRAGVAPATAYNYFSSREHLVTELFWRRLISTPGASVDRRRSTLSRVGDTLRAITTVVADEPELSAACTQAMLSSDSEVALLRARIGAEMHRRVVAALGEDARPAVVRSLEIAISGAMLQTGMGYLTYDNLSDRLTETAALLIRPDATAAQHADE